MAVAGIWPRRSSPARLAHLLRRGLDDRALRVVGGDGPDEDAHLVAVPLPESTSTMVVRVEFLSCVEWSRTGGTVGAFDGRPPARRASLVDGLRSVGEG